LPKIGNNWPIFKLFSAIFTFFRSCDSFRMIKFKNETFKKKSKYLNFWSLFPILATIYEVKISFWKKLVETPLMTYFQIDIFWIHMLWGRAYQVSDGFFVQAIWVNKSLSMMWAVWLKTEQNNWPNCLCNTTTGALPKPVFLVNDKNRTKILNSKHRVMKTRPSQQNKTNIFSRNNFSLMF
jgi:hypothetical protein